jgi:hypothetical protein
MNLIFRSGKVGRQAIPPPPKYFKKAHFCSKNMLKIIIKKIISMFFG